MKNSEECLSQEKKREKKMNLTFQVFFTTEVMKGLFS